MTPDALGKVKTLECCCCGESTRGRQWWNRDTGYGICRKCIAWLRERNTPEAEITDLYGQEGVHFDVDEHADLRAILGEALSK